MRTLFQYSICLPVFALLLFSNIHAQDDKELLAELVAADEEAVNALVLYPEDTRMAILAVSLYPEALIKLEHIQSQTRTDFQELLAQYPQSTQEVLWDLTRYPNLIAQLVEINPQTSKDWQQLLADYPDIIHQRAKEAYRDYLADLKAINTLNEEADLAFETLLHNYPTATQEALHHLLPLPEVLSILTENIRLTVLVGALYREDPAWLLPKIDSLNLAVARQNAQELEDWKTSLEEDPTAMEQLTASAEAFKEEYNYDDDYYDYTQDDLYYQDQVTDRTLHDYYFYHFPYWFGYPEWYYYPRWRFYPSWYDWGFYWGANRTVVVIGLPSFYFTHWYFYSPRHHYRWAYLSAHFTRHHYRHQRHGSSIATGVRVWQERNKAVVSREWLRDDNALPTRFRAYGKFELDRARYNRTHPNKVVTQRQFIEKNSRRYPVIAKEATRQRLTAPKTTARPPKGKEATSKVPSRPQPRTIEKPKSTTKTLPPKQKAPRTIPRVKEGTERHRSISERLKSTKTRKEQSRKPRIQAPKKKIIKPKTSTKKGSTRKTSTKKTKPRKSNG